MWGFKNGLKSRTPELTEFALGARPHIVIVGKYYPPQHGGIERYTADVARIAARKYRVTVLVHSIGPKDHVEVSANPAITIIRCGTKRIISSQPISPSMLMHLRSLKPDLIHFNAPNFWAAAALLLSRPKCPMVITHHADVFGRLLLKRLLLPIYRALVRRSACVIVNSLKNAHISPDLPQNFKSIKEIPWGVDVSDYDPSERDTDCFRAERLRRFNGAPVIGFVGRFVRYKGLPVLIEALRSIPTAHAMLIGDGPLRDQIVDQIAASGLVDRVHFLGNLDEKTKIREMLFMDVLAFPSLETSEAFGLVQVEAQLLNIPVVACDLPTGVTDVTIHHETGILVSPGDPVSLASALRLLCDQPSLARGYGHAGRQRALNNFTMEKFEQKIGELLDTQTNSSFKREFFGSLTEIRAADLA